MKKLACFLALMVVTGCSARTGTVPTVPPTGQLSPTGQVGSNLSVAVPLIEDLKGAAMTPNTRSNNPPPPLRVGYPDQRAVIAKVLEMIAAAAPVPDPPTRYVDHSPVFTLYLAQGGGVPIAPAYQCAAAPDSAAPSDCSRVEGQVTLFSAADAKPVRLRSPELVACLEGGWAKNWSVASAPESVVIYIQVHGGDYLTPSMINGEGITHTTVTGEKCIPDQQPGL